MDLRGISSTDIFVPTGQQSDLEGLANNALKSAIDLYMSKNYKAAVKEFKRSMGLAQNSPSAIDAANYMADAYLKLDDTEGAIKAYKEAIRLNPYRDDVHIKLGNLYFSDERYQEAKLEYQEAVKINPISNNYFSLGQAYLKTERYGDAERQFRKVQRLEPENPNGNFGLGLAFSKQERHEDAIRQFKTAVGLKHDFYEAHAEIGYAFADMGLMERAREMVAFLEIQAPELAETLSGYMYKVDPPKFEFAYATSTFSYYMPSRTPVSALDSYLKNADASKTLNMKFQFDKAMDRESVQNIFNWKIGRAAATGPGQAYNFGLPLPDTETEISLYPEHIYYDAEDRTATVYFTIRQNSTADGTIDPSHIEFKFSGKDIYGNSMDENCDQFMGFSGVA